MRTWIASASIVAALAAPLAVHAASCDSPSLVAPCAAHAAGASFLDLMADSATSSIAPQELPEPQALTQPAVYVGDGSAASHVTGVPAAIVVAGRVVDGFLSGGSGPGWLPAAGPAPDFAWPFALGFLGLIVLRRTRAARGF